MVPFRLSDLLVRVIGTLFRVFRTVPALRGRYRAYSPRPGIIELSRTIRPASLDAEPFARLWSVLQTSSV